MCRSFIFRFFCCALVLATGLIPAVAQMERSLEERLLRPDMNQQSTFDGQLFRGTSSFEGQAFRGSGASELSERRVRGREFEPKRFLGIPIPWTRDTRVRTFANPMENRTFATSASSLTKESRESRRAFLGQTNVVQEVRRASSLDRRQAHIEGTNQQNLSQQRNPVSPEELRALLNKQVPILSHQNGTTNGSNPR